MWRQLVGVWTAVDSLGTSWHQDWVWQWPLDDALSHLFLCVKLHSCFVGQEEAVQQSCTCTLTGSHKTPTLTRVNNQQGFKCKWLHWCPTEPLSKHPDKLEPKLEPKTIGHWNVNSKYLTQHFIHTVMLNKNITTTTHLQFLWKWKSSGRSDR